MAHRRRGGGPDHRRRGTGARCRLRGGGAARHPAFGPPARCLPGHHRRLPACDPTCPESRPPAIVGGRGQPARARGPDCRPCDVDCPGSYRPCCWSPPPWRSAPHREPDRRRRPRALPTLRSPTFSGANVSGTAAVSGPITAPGGPYLYDRQGRIVFFHGVNAVYKHPPYVLYADPGEAVELLRRRRLPDGPARLQRGASRGHLERAGARDGAGQRPRHLRPRAAGRSAPVQPGRVRPLRQPGAGDRGPARPLPHLHDPRHAPGRVQRDVRR